MRAMACLLLVVVAVAAGAMKGEGRSLGAGQILFGGTAYAPMKPFLGVQIFRASTEKGSCQRILAFAPAEARGVQFTRDGRYAILTLGGSLTPSSAIVGMRFIDLRGGKTWDVPNIEGAVSTGGMWIAASDQHGHLLVMRNDGSDSRVVATRSGRSVEYGTAWSPNDRWLAVSVSTGGGADGPPLKTHLEVANLATGSARVIYKEPNPYSYRPYPVWSPDSRLLYVWGVEHPFVIARDGSGRHFLPVEAGQGIWSPDGRRIAFIGHGRWGVNDVFVANADGSRARALTATKPPPIGEEQRGSVPLAWSPDGRQILYLRRFTLTVMNANGSVSRAICQPPRGTQGAVTWTK